MRDFHAKCVKITQTGISLDLTLASATYWHARPQTCAGQLRMVPIGTEPAGKPMAFELQNLGCEVNYVITGGDHQRHRQWFLHQRKWNVCPLQRNRRRL